MSQHEFKTRTDAMLESSRSKRLGAEAILKELPGIIRLHPNTEELSYFLNQLNFSSPNLVAQVQGSVLESLVSSTPLEYLGYLVDYLKISTDKVKGISKKLEEEFVLKHDYECLLSSKDKDQVLRNATKKIQRIFPLFRLHNRRLLPHEALRLVCFLPLQSTNEKKIFKELSTILTEEVTKIKWEQIYELLNQSIPTRGHYGLLIGMINKNHEQIADGIMRLLRSNFDLEICLTSLLYECLAPGLLKVIEIVTKRLFLSPNPQTISSYMQRIMKPIMLLNLQRSKYYLEIQDIILATLIRTRDPIYPLKQKDIIPDEVHRTYPKEHLRLLVDITNCWVNPAQKLKILNRLQSMEPSDRKKDNDPSFSRTQTKISQPSGISQLSTTSKFNKTQDEGKYSEHPKLLLNSQKVMAPISPKMDQSKVIMFECNDYIGIPNVGNTCYINSFIQNLLFCGSFMNAFMKSDIEKYPVYHLLKKLLVQLKERNSAKLGDLLIQFKRQLPTTFSIDGTQQDSMEFGRELINGMMSLPELNTGIKRIFITKTKMITQCPNGDISSSIQESNSEIILPFQHPLIISKLKSNTNISPIKMGELLNAYFASNEIEREYKCDKCKKKFNKCVRITELLEVPETLIIVLSRFMYDVTLQKKRKILDVVALDDYIHFGNVKTNSKIRAQYRLISFIVHLGNQAESGHYQVYVKHPKEEDCWIIFDDDNSVMQVNCQSARALAQNLAVEESPYILFYSRI